TLDTAGLLAIDAKGQLVGSFDADFELNVAWNPLDLLLRGDVRYKSSDLITGYLYLHAWRGQGWQNQYYWLPADDSALHFTGQIGGSVRIPSGELINAPLLKIPPFAVSIGADISFGEFCNNANCQPSYPWGVAATVTVLDYKAGIYVDSSGPEIILGTKGKILIDQAGGGSLLPVAAAAEAGGVIYTPGLQQQLLLPDWRSPLDGLMPSHNNCSVTMGGTRHSCPLTVTNGVGRANFMSAWLNGSLTVSLIDPDGNVYTGSDIGAGVVFSESYVDNIHYASYAVASPDGMSTIADGAWHVRLDNVAVQPDEPNHYSLLFTADPPAPTLALTTPAVAGEPGTDNYLIQYDASRGGADLGTEVDLELFYLPVFAPDPLPPTDLEVFFPGDYAEQLGGVNWTPGDPVVRGEDSNGDGVYRLSTTLAAGTYAYKVTVGDSWAQNYGLDGVPGGPPITFTVDAPADPIIFYYDRRDNTIVNRPETDIVVLVGDMMSELGGADNNPANLVGWLKAAGDGL
ncbi:MAG: hypothetical protein KDE09_24840, partial [Anaerolineales bacterium]|nr:hypothetical protein [Anaerolineales bacterium]